MGVQRAARLRDHAPAQQQECHCQQAHQPIEHDSNDQCPLDPIIDEEPLSQPVSRRTILNYPLELNGARKALRKDSLEIVYFMEIVRANGPRT